jgi:hypothetical protein
MNKKERLSNHLPDLTEFDFNGADLYMSKPDSTPLYCKELTKADTIKRSWGKQEMIAGDWVVFKTGFTDGKLKKSGIRRDAFLATYEESEIPGHYVKRSFVRAVRIEVDYCFLGIDSEDKEIAKAGTYLTLNLDKNREPIVINGRRDLFFYKEENLLDKYLLIGN